MVFNAEGIIQAFKNTVGLKVAKTIPLMVEVQLLYNVLILAHIVWIRQWIREQNLRSNFLTGITQFSYLRIEAAGTAKNMGHIKLIVILKITHTAVLLGYHIAEIGLYPAINRGTAWIFSLYCLNHQFL